MIIDCISDLHGHYPELEGGDLLIIAGDLTKRGTKKEYYNFIGFCDVWAGTGLKSYKNIVVVGGNHDNYLQKTKKNVFQIMGRTDVKYLQDSGTEFNGLKIWGSPWTKSFEGMNPKCKAFTVDTDEELAKKWELIPTDIDILVTHSPPFGVLDKIENNESVGSRSLSVWLLQQGYSGPKLHVFGHTHESYGFKMSVPTQFINASHVNEHYDPVNKPIRIVL